MFYQITGIPAVLVTASAILFALVSGHTGKADKQQMIPSLGGATGWVNTAPLKLADLRGKVVLVDFWTYSCINGRRTLPYIREWAKKYKEQGLVVIGVHTPEFTYSETAERSFAR